MNRSKIFSIIILLFLTIMPLAPIQADPPSHAPVQTISSRIMGMTNRHPVPAANEVYKDNILLTISYLVGETKQGTEIDWDAVRRLGTRRFIVPTGRTFAFHDSVLPQYANRLAGSTNAHFGGHEGFKSDGYLMGTGVCHLASLIGWAAKDAKLDVVAPTNHDFAAIPDIPREHGVAIYSIPNSAAGAAQNLYVTNTLGHDVVFELHYDGLALSATVTSAR